MAVTRIQQKTNERRRPEPYYVWKWHVITQAQQNINKTALTVRSHKLILAVYNMAAVVLLEQTSDTWPACVTFSFRRILRLADSPVTASLKTCVLFACFLLFSSPRGSTNRALQLSSSRPGDICQFSNSKFQIWPWLRSYRTRHIGKLRIIHVFLTFWHTNAHVSEQILRVLCKTNILNESLLTSEKFRIRDFPKAKITTFNSL